MGSGEKLVLAVAMRWRLPDKRVTPAGCKHFSSNQQQPDIPVPSGSVKSRLAG